MKHSPATGTCRQCAESSHGCRSGLGGIHKQAVVEEDEAVERRSSGSEQAQSCAVSGVEQECAILENVPRRVSAHLDRGVGSGARPRVPPDIAVLEDVLSRAEKDIAGSGGGGSGSVSHSLDIAVDESIALSGNRETDFRRDAGGKPLKPTHVLEAAAIAGDGKEVGEGCAGSRVGDASALGYGRRCADSDQVSGILGPRKTSGKTCR